MFEIHYLADRQQHIPTIAAWHYSQWGELHPTNDVVARIEEFQGHLQQRVVPTTFVACDGDEVIGSASLLASDLDIRMEYTPWLASVYVSPAARNQGIGAALVQRVMAEARAIGIPRLYLFTESSEAFYAKLGWRLLERTNYQNLEIAIMVCDFVS